MDATTSALIGTVIGGVIGIVGTIISVVASARLEETRYRRTRAQERTDRVRSSYEFALNVFFNLRSSGHPDRATMGDTFARLSLYGSPKVKALLDAYVNGQDSQGPIEVDRLCEAMRAHLEALDPV